MEMLQERTDRTTTRNVACALVVSCELMGPDLAMKEMHNSVGDQIHNDFFCSPRRRDCNLRSIGA